MFNRRDAIEALVANDMYVSMDYADTMESFLRYGFVGYDNMTNDELIEALQDRDIEV